MNPDDERAEAVDATRGCLHAMLVSVALVLLVVALLMLVGCGTGPASPGPVPVPPPAVATPSSYVPGGLRPTFDAAWDAHRFGCAYPSGLIVDELVAAVENELDGVPRLDAVIAAGRYRDERCPGR